MEVLAALEMARVKDVISTDPSTDPSTWAGLQFRFIDKPCTLVPGYTWPRTFLSALQMYLQVPGLVFPLF